MRQPGESCFLVVYKIFLLPQKGGTRALRLQPSINNPAYCSIGVSVFENSTPPLCIFNFFLCKVHRGINFEILAFFGNYRVVLAAECWRVVGASNNYKKKHVQKHLHNVLCSLLLLCFAFYVVLRSRFMYSVEKLWFNGTNCCILDAFSGNATIALELRRFHTCACFIQLCCSCSLRAWKEKQLHYSVMITASTLYASM